MHANTSTLGGGSTQRRLLGALLHVMMPPPTAHHTVESTPMTTKIRKQPSHHKMQTNRSYIMQIAGGPACTLSALWTTLPVVPVALKSPTNQWLAVSPVQRPPAELWLQHQQCWPFLHPCPAYRNSQCKKTCSIMQQQFLVPVQPTQS